MRPLATLAFCALSTVAPLLHAQDAKDLFDKAPPAVDEALRARIHQFYLAHVDGKYRIADQVVAEDSKDFYFAAQKPKYNSCETVRINYSENFTKADAVIACKADWYIHGERNPTTLTITSNWKIENGEWFWYIKQQDLNERATPFGTMHYGDRKPEDPVSPPVIGNPLAAARDILAQVRVDKKDVMLSSYQPATETVEIKNGMPGSISLRAAADALTPGLSLQLDKTELNAGETAHLILRMEPKDKTAKATTTVRISISPTGQSIPVTVRYAIPPEIERMIPKVDAPASTRK